MEEKDIACGKTYSSFKVRIQRAIKKFIAAVAALGVTFGFVGCAGVTVEPNNTPGHNPQPENPTPDNPIVTPEKLTFAEFLNNHHDKAVEFADSLAKSDIGGKTLVSREIRMEANAEEQLSHVSYAYGYKVDETQRTFKVVNFDFVNPVDLNKIVDGSIDSEDLVTLTTERELLTVDAKENYQRQDVLNAVIGCVRNIYGRNVLNSTVKLFAQEQNASGSDTMRLLEMGKDGATVYKFDVVHGENDENLIKNLQNSSRVNNFSQENFDFDGTNVLSESYVLEEFKDDEKTDPPVDDDKKVESMEQLLSEYKSEVTEGLSAGYDNLVEKVIPKTILGFDASKLDDCRWNFDCDTNGNISKINLISTYNSKSTSSTILISSITLKNPIILNNLTNKNIVEQINQSVESGTGKLEQYFVYDKTIQEENLPLAEAIFDVEGKKIENSKIYYYKDLPTTDYDLGAVNQFRAFQITENGVEEIRVIVKNASSLEGYIKNLQNGKYKVTKDTSYKFGNFTYELGDSYANNFEDMGM